MGRASTELSLTVAERLPTHLHPLLATLEKNPASAREFWARISDLRTPLIEPDPSSPGHSIVTYVFALPESARHVVVLPGFDEYQGAIHLMDRIAGTDVLHASYRYRNDVRTSYSFVPDLPLLSIDSADADEMRTLRAFVENLRPLFDPHHREHVLVRMGAGKPDVAASFVSLPDAPDERLAYKRENVPHGRIDRHSFASAIMGNERRVWVYTPPGYDVETADYPVLVVFDGAGALSSVPVQRLLDNLLAERRIAPTIAVLIDNPAPTSRNDELPCNENFASFIARELLPWVEKNYRVRRDAAGRYVTGMSYGGLAAMWMGYRLPHIFGNVIAQAASLWWGPGYRFDVPRSAGGYEAEWLIRQYAQSPRLPVRFWMEIGLMEHPSLMLDTNRRMKAVLEEKGYELLYSEPAGGHDSALWRGSLGRALAAMLPH